MRTRRGVVVLALAAAGLVLSCKGAAPGGSPSLIPAQPAQAAGAASTAESRRVLRGRVVGHDGAPMTLAHAIVLGPDGKKPLAETEARPDGSFVLPLADVADRVARVQLTGVDHRVETVLVATDDAPVEATFRLGTYRAPAKLERLSVVELLDGGGMRPYPLAAQPDGTWVAELALGDGRHGLEVQGLTVEGHVVNGTFGDVYEYDGDGDYKSVVTVTDGTIKLVLDPKKRPPPGRPASIAFAARGSTSDGLSDVYRRVAEARARVNAVAGEAMERGQDPSAAASADAFVELRRGLAETARSHPQPVVRQAAAVAYFANGTFGAPTDEERARARASLDALKPTDPFWSYWPALHHVLSVAARGADGEAYGAAFASGHPDVHAVSDYLVERLATEKDPSKARALVATLRTSRFAGTVGQSAATYLDPDRATAVGKEIAFDLKALAADKVDPRKTFTPKSFAGKVFLVDVWATWCKPCVAELPKIHEVFAKYGSANAKGKRLTILSVSVDQKPEDVARFRLAKDRSMPWLHAFAGHDETALKLLTGDASPAIPLYILVDDAGKILASSPELSANSLPAILDRVLK